MDKRGVEGTIQNGDSRDDEASTAAGRMLRAVNSAAAGGGVHAGELDAAAKALVTQLRGENQPPEQVLVQIKQILAEAGLRPSHGPADPTVIFERHAALYRTVIESSIRHYFATNEGSGSTNA